MFDSEHVADAFFNFIQLRDATAQDRCDRTVAAFAKWMVPYQQNMVGFATDGANVMMGTRNSLMTHLREDIPNLVMMMKCICHSFHLSASYACKKLPHVVEGEVKDIPNARKG